MLKAPKGVAYWYIDDKTEKWCIREDAPDWAKKEFAEFQKMANPEPDDNDIITMY